MSALLILSCISAAKSWNSLLSFSLGLLVIFSPNFLKLFSRFRVGDEIGLVCGTPWDWLGIGWSWVSKDLTETVCVLVGCCSFEEKAVLETRLIENVTGQWVLYDHDVLADNLEFCVFLAFEEVTGRNEAISVLNDGDVIVRWLEQGEVMEATELSDRILVWDNDDTPLMELEKLGDLLLIFWPIKATKFIFWFMWSPLYARYVTPLSITYAAQLYPIPLTLTPYPAPSLLTPSPSR